MENQAKDAFFPTALARDAFVCALVIGCLHLVVYVIGFAISSGVLGPSAAIMYLKPMAIILAKTGAASLVYGVGAFLIYSAARFVQKTLLPTSLHSGRHIRLHIFHTHLWVSVAVCYVISWSLFSVGRYFTIGALYQRTEFPNTHHPSIEIRYSGFVDQSFHVFLAGPLYKQNILELPASLVYRSPTNPPPNSGEGKTRLAMAHFDPYAIWWSSNNDRVAFSIDTDYVGAYDIRTGEKIEMNGHPVARDVLAFLREHSPPFHK